MEEPIRAVIHIQKTAPAPPAEIAATTPTRLPIPTRVAVETIKVWMTERALCSSPFFSKSAPTISLKRRIGRNFVRIVKYTPVGISKMTKSERGSVPPPGKGTVSKSPHKKLYTVSINLTILICILLKVVYNFFLIL